MAEDDLHRRLGVEANNETWRLLAEGGPGPDADDDARALLLYRTYASAYHWMETASATRANWARAEHLVSRAAVAVGLPDVALRHATRCKQLCDAAPDVVEDWDLAFAEEALARAHAAAGDEERARRHRSRARRLGEAIADADDRHVFLRELDRPPWFGVRGR